MTAYADLQARLRSCEARASRWGEQVQALVAALRTAEAALADIGDATRESGDDVAWCERRAAAALPAVRAVTGKGRV